MRGLRFRGCFGLKVKETVEIRSLTLIFPLFEYFPTYNMLNTDKIFIDLRKSILQLVYGKY